LNCPYLDCNYRKIQTDTIHCPDCSRYLKTCERCSSPNRAFAVYCCECGKLLPESDADWPAFKGGWQRLGLNRFVLNRRIPELGTGEMGGIQLSDPCKSLLICDRHLFAISQSGEIKVADISQNHIREVTSFHAGGNIYAMPVIERGSLYMAAEKELLAYSLGNMFSQKAPVSPRWEISSDGTPIRELLAFQNRLFFTLTYPDRHHEIHALDSIRSVQPKPPEKLCAGPRLSSIAGHYTEKVKKVYFLSEDQIGLRLHLTDYSKNSGAEAVSLMVKGAPSPFRERVPIAVIGARIFLVFRKEETLCRLDANTGEVDRQFCKNIREFAMAGINDPVATISEGLFFQRINKKVDIGNNQTIKGSPLILKDCAVVVGMRDGNVHLYDLHNPALPLIWSVSEHSDEEITVLAASQNIIAAGNDKGRVRVCRLV